MWQRVVVKTITRVLGATAWDFPGRWRLEHLAVRLVRLVGPSLRPRVVRTRDGFLIWADPSEWVGQYIYATGRYEEDTVRLMRTLLSAGDEVIDVGANVGYLALAAARLVGRDGRVTAFEPLPAARAWLERNLQLNPDLHVLVRPEAVSDTSGWALLNIGPAHHTSTASVVHAAAGAGSVKVPCVRLDDAVSGSARLRLIKIDVEGAEPLVIRGAERLLETWRPALIVELNGPETSEALVNRGFAGFTPDGDPIGEWNGQANALFRKERPPGE